MKNTPLYTQFYQYLKIDTFELTTSKTGCISKTRIDKDCSYIINVHKS